MSGPERPPEPTAPTTKLKRKQFSDDDQTELDKLDGIFKRFKKAIPQTPYILSTPSLHPYHHRSRHDSQAWMMGRLFRPDEEALQYRTFLFREPYQDCFTLQPGEDDEPEVRPSKSQVAQVASQVPKKKISLSDYKSKQANGVITPGAKKPSPTLPATKPAIPHTNGVQLTGQRPPSSPKKEDQVKPPKRSAPEPLPEKPAKRIQEDTAAAPTLPPKPEPTESKSEPDKSGPSNSTPHGLPPMLSPVYQPLSNPYGLPAILSPTLPSSIQAELDRLETQRKRAESNASSSSSDRKSQLLSVSDARSQNQDGRPDTSARERSTSLNGRSPSNAKPVQNEEADNSLVVRLKYTKKSRETIKRLLNLPPKREVAAERKEREDSSKDRANLTAKKSADSLSLKAKPVTKIAARRTEGATTTTTSSSKTSIATSKTAEKRPRLDDDTALATPSKRPRGHSSLQEGPNTPKDQLLASPALSTKSSAQKSHVPLSTPRKDLKPINMLRTASAESHDSTPGKSGAPLSGSKHLDVKAPTSAPLNSKKQLDYQLLQHASMKLNQMGRSLKYEGRDFEKDRGNKLSKEDKKRAAIIGLECILSYMAAYHAQDASTILRGRPAEVDATWKTLLPLCVSYARLTKDFPHIDGFRSYLGAVIAAHICMLLAPRAPNVGAKPHDSPHELSQAELAKQHAHLTDNFSLLSTHYMYLLRHTQDARMLLPMDELRKQYPKTWAGAETNTKIAKVPEKSAKLSGPYFLPVQNDTTPIQAARFGLSFLAELCEKERIDHALRVNLDKVD